MAALAQCAYCDKDFISTRPYHVYCSRKCGYAAYIYPERHGPVPMTTEQKTVMRSSWGYEGQPLAGGY